MIVNVNITKKLNMGKIKNIDEKSFGKTLFKIGTKVTFMWNDTLKEGAVFIVDAHGTFGRPGMPSYDIMVDSENMLYKHVTCDKVNKKI